jgi:hypothetical protein
VGAAERGIDLILIRESTEGLFASMGKGVVTETEARETLLITRKTSERLFDFSFRLAQRRKTRGKCITVNPFLSCRYACRFQVIEPVGRNAGNLGGRKGRRYCDRQRKLAACAVGACQDHARHRTKCVVAEEKTQDRGVAQGPLRKPVNQMPADPAIPPPDEGGRQPAGDEISHRR